VSTFAESTPSVNGELSYPLIDGFNPNLQPAHQFIRDQDACRTAATLNHDHQFNMVWRRHDGMGGRPQRCVNLLCLGLTKEKGHDCRCVDNH
jgi:hypothetical protein